MAEDDEMSDRLYRARQTYPSLVEQASKQIPVANVGSGDFEWYNANRVHPPVMKRVLLWCDQTGRPAQQHHYIGHWNSKNWSEPFVRFWRELDSPRPDQLKT